MLFNVKIYFHLKKRVTEYEKREEAERVSLCALVRSLNGCNSPGWTRSKSGVKNFKSMEGTQVPEPALLLSLY